MPKVTVWRRVAGGWSNHEQVGLSDAIDLPEIGAVLALADLYDGLVFPPNVLPPA